MFSFLMGLNIRFYIGIGLVLFAIWGIYYVNDLKSDLANEKLSKEIYKEKLEEANKNNELIIQAYEQTIKVEREISEQKTITNEQKQEVIKATSKVKEVVIKRGEIKQDEKSNFTIVNF